MAMKNIVLCRVNNLWFDQEFQLPSTKSYHVYDTSTQLQFHFVVSSTICFLSHDYFPLTILLLYWIFVVMLRSVWVMIYCSLGCFWTPYPPALSSQRLWLQADVTMTSSHFSSCPLNFLKMKRNNFPCYRELCTSFVSQDVCNIIVLW